METKLDNVRIFLYQMPYICVKLRPRICICIYISPLMVNIIIVLHVSFSLSPEHMGRLHSLLAL